MRNQRGERNNGAKATERQVAAAKGLAVKGVRQAVIMRHLGLSRSNVWAILHGQTWQHTSPDLTVLAPSQEAAPTQKRCPRCQAVKPLSEFPPRRLSRTGRNSYCRACKNEMTRARRHTERHAAITRLGGVCVCCFEARPEFLSFDHVNGDGGRDRRERGHRPIVEDILADKTGQIRLLCHNCNMSRGFYGYCPHDRAVAVGAAPMADFIAG